MTYKLIGVVLVVVACGSVGFRIAANHKQEERALRQLMGILDYMACELQYMHTSLPDLCRQVCRDFRSMLGQVFGELSLEMEAQQHHDLSSCMSTVLEKMSFVPPITKSKMELLGMSIGRFDLEGQLKGLEALRQDCRRSLDSLESNREHRLRSYQTLGLCAGAALAILFV